MPNNCHTCNSTLGDKVVSCDSCHIVMHPTEDCTGLCASEIRATVIQKRTLFFFCSDCRLAFKNVPALLRQIEVLKSEIDSLKKEVSSLKEATKVTDESVVAEMCERQKRASTIVLFNVSEDGQVDDMRLAKDVVMDLVSEELVIKKVFRSGKKNKKGARALKIVFSNAADASKLLRAKRGVLKEKQIFISADLTRCQVEHLNNLKREVDERRSRGERDLGIKYNNGIPQIAKFAPKN